ncbi:hypothetical protein BHU72_04005 [Desulfuribacillus stibiiarsenatis]|uniref:EamA domain-containing protein n=1 Tax=Desulfuribacillus stibiiarsenatis TaxID=1390249 RepID=A0A1E5L5C6_9FIRM|nr:EamA family transporter [Desulfuribacillus stibiiarsenatis]OEH85268.1 hypothetical protein BHU72_04005 [Desulfuribacillus stibiiarsenatis]
MGFFFAFMVGLGFASGNILVRKGMKQSDEQDNGVLTTVIINVIFLGIAWLIYRLLYVTVELNWIGTLYYVFAGIFTTFLGRQTLFMSYRKIGAPRGSAIKNSAPLFTAVFALVILGETMGWLPFAGFVFVLLGLGIQGLFMIRQGNKLSTDMHVERIGYYLALASAMSFGVGQGIRKSGLLELPDPYYGAFISGLVALLMTILWEARTGNIREKLIGQVKRYNPFYLAAGVCTSIAMLSFFIAITYIQVSYVAAVAALEPLLTIILSKLFLKQEEIQRYTIVASMTVFAGVLMLILFT